MPTIEETEEIIHHCEWCSDVIEEEDYDGGEYTTTVNGEEICTQCAEDTFACTDCGNVQHVDESHHAGANERRVCESCFYDHYFYCEGCDVAWPNEVYGGDGYCEDCYSDCSEDYDCDCDECSYSERGEGIRRWGDRPELMFHHDGDWGHVPKAGTYYMGMEIELEDSARIVGPSMGAVTRHMFATTDASLESSRGVEIVTHPHTFEAWNESFPWEWWSKNVHDVVPDQSYWDSNGIHIHVSRTAFYNSKGKAQASHLYKFMQFIQVNQRGIQYLAGRDGNTYCRWDQERDALTRLPDAKSDTSQRNWERYRPINTQNADTIELRFFDGTSDPVFMKRSIQFVHSLVEFTRIGNFKSDRSWKAYASYIRRYALRYPELAVFMHNDKDTLEGDASYSAQMYKNDVMPNIKLEKVKVQEREAIERRNVIEQERQREEVINSRPDCPCGYCEQDRRVPNERGTPIHESWYEQHPIGSTRTEIMARNTMIRASGIRYTERRLAYTEPINYSIADDTPTMVEVQYFTELTATRREPTILSRPSS